MTEPVERKCPTNSSNLRDVLLDTTVSSRGKTITIECGSHDTKDALLEFLTCGVVSQFDCGEPKSAPAQNVENGAARKPDYNAEAGNSVVDTTSLLM